jgi:ParB family chromosome partitioning protein
MAKKRLSLVGNPLLSGPSLLDREHIGVPYREIQISQIQRDPNQPRQLFDEERLKELAASIATYGVLSPILVRATESPGIFRLIAGERRLRAAGMAGLSAIPALVDQSDESSGERTLAMQLVENIQRADLSPLERAHAIGALRDSFNLSVREVAEKLGISKSMVQRSLDILSLPDDLLNALRDGAPESKILLLAKIEDEEIRASYLKDIDLLTRSQLQKDLEKEKAQLERQSFVSPEDRRIADEMQRSIGLKVRLQRTNPESVSGRLVIDFYSDTDLQLLFRRLVGDE